MQLPKSLVICEDHSFTLYAYTGQMKFIFVKSYAKLGILNQLHVKNVWCILRDDLPNGFKSRASARVMSAVGAKTNQKVALYRKRIKLAGRKPGKMPTMF